MDRFVLDEGSPEARRHFGRRPGPGGAFSGGGSSENERHAPAEYAEVSRS
jgi:hypothetical protein